MGIDNPNFEGDDSIEDNSSNSLQNKQNTPIIKVTSPPIEENDRDSLKASETSTEILPGSISTEEQGADNEVVVRIVTDSTDQYSKTVEIPLGESQPTDRVDEKHEETKSDTKLKGSVAVYRLFRYATALDLLFLLIGTLGAIANGAAVPISLLFFTK